MELPGAFRDGDPGQVTRIAEEFIRLHEAGKVTDLDEFCSRFPEKSRSCVRSECEHLLQIHGVMKNQEWLVPGQSLASYEILELLGTGGMSDVYRARDSKLDREVAIKVLPPELGMRAECVSRFESEARAIAALDHPNIVTVHSVEECEGLHFITMQLVEGKTLSELIPKRGFSSERFFDLAIPLADAISTAHTHGIIHRDLKPNNIMVTAEGRVEVLDFGLAKLRQDVAADRTTGVWKGHVTSEGQILGTVDYMSPEQAEGRLVDYRTDIFSLGIILYEMATGDRPFKGETRVSVLSSIVKDAAPLVTELRPTLPHDLERLLRLCLHKRRDRRLQSAKDLRNELVDLRTALAGAVSPRRKRRRRTRSRSSFTPAQWSSPQVEESEEVGKRTRVTTFHENGRKYWEGSYVDGRLDGPWMRWAPCGAPEMCGHYASGEKSGLWTTYEISTGHVCEQGAYEGGFRTGVWRRWWCTACAPDEWMEVTPDENEVLESEGAYVLGKRHGSWKFWWRTSQPRAAGEYLEGRKAGRWRYWKDDGSVDAERTGDYENNVRTS